MMGLDPVTLERKEQRGSEIQFDQIYDCVRFTIPTIAGNAPAGSQFEFLQDFDRSGDTIYVDQVNTSVPLYIRVGARRNPWIRIREGDVLRRRFRRITLAAGQTGGQRGINAGGGTAFWPGPDAVLYLSSGDLVHRPTAINYGFERGLISTRGTVGVAPVPFLATVITCAGIPPWSFGRRGGHIKLQNDDSTGAATLFFGYGLFAAPPAVASMFQIFNNQRLEIDFRGATEDANAGLLFCGTVAATPFSALISGFEADSVVGSTSLTP